MPARPARWRRRTRPLRPAGSRDPGRRDGPGGRAPPRRDCPAAARPGRSSDELGEVLEQLALALGADEALHLLAVLEHQEGRDAHHVEAPSGVGVVVDVELADGELALLLAGDLGERGGDHLAGTTPLGPEVDEHGRVGAGNGLVERRIGEGEDFVGHGGGPFLRSVESTDVLLATTARRPAAFPTDGVGYSATRPMVSMVSRRQCSSCSPSQRSASMAAMHPDPEAVIAWRNTWSCTSPAANTPSTDVRVESAAVTM